MGAVTLPSGNVGFASYHSDCVGELQLIVAPTPPSPPPSSRPGSLSHLLLIFLILIPVATILFGLFVWLRWRPWRSAQEWFLAFHRLADPPSSSDPLASRCLDGNSSLAPEQSPRHSSPEVSAAPAWPSSGSRASMRQITQGDVVLLVVATRIIA